MVAAKFITVQTLFWFTLLTLIGSLHMLPIFLFKKAVHSSSNCKGEFRHISYIFCSKTFLANHMNCFFFYSKLESSVEIKTNYKKGILIAWQRMIYKMTCISVLIIMGPNCHSHLCFTMTYPTWRYTELQCCKLIFSLEEMLLWWIVYFSLLGELVNLFSTQKE